MKKIVFILLSMLIISCSNDDDDSGISQRLSGNWYLTSVDCFCGFDPEIDFKDFTLRFDDLQIHLDNPTEGYFYIAESGSYGYTLEGSVIKINGADPFHYELKGSTLILTLIDEPSIADDELVLTYEKQ